MNFLARLTSLILCCSMLFALTAPVRAEELPVSELPAASDSAECDSDLPESDCSDEFSADPEEEEADTTVPEEELTDAEEPAQDEEEVVETAPTDSSIPEVDVQMPKGRSVVNANKISLEVGQTAVIHLNGEAADDYESSAVEVASVDPSGVVTARAAGTTEITITGPDNQEYGCIVEVDGILSKDSVTIPELKTATITVKGAKIASVSSSNTKVATVTKAGKITAEGPGSCTIKVTDTVGNVYKCKVTVTTSYLNRVAANAKYVYGLIVSLHCRHAIGIHSLSELKKKKIVTCNSSASVAMQLSGLLPTGKIMGHTEAVGGNEVKRKNSVSKAIKKTNLLKSGTCTIIRAGKNYSSLPSKYKQPGMIYIQDSNMCISAGDGYVYSCNESSSEMRSGRYIRTKVNNGYPFSHPILYIIAPKG